MKKVYKLVVVLFAILILASNVSFGQGHIVTYQATGKLTQNRPDFTNAIIAMDFQGPVVESAKNTFRELGASKFSEPDFPGANPCKVPAITVVCVSLQIGQGIELSSSSSSSSYGSSTGVYGQASFSGQLFPINVVVSIMHNDKNGNTSTTPLAMATDIAAVGNSYESFGSYGRYSGGAFSITTTGGLDSAIGNSIHRDFVCLLGSGLSRFLNAKTFDRPWRPGADQEVALAFAEQKQ